MLQSKKNISQFLQLTVKEVRSTAIRFELVNERGYIKSIHSELRLIQPLRLNWHLHEL